jgi:calcineurin-like phosphoesterase family protein
MSEVFFCSDHHFGHNNIIKFTDKSGNKIRPFDSIEQMHETIIPNHNSVVGKNDIVYFLGDVTFNKKYLPLLNEMNGEKYLVKGNHDCFNATTYLEYFKDIYGVIKKYDFVLTHVPIHPSQLDRWKLNIHGHLHKDIVLLDNVPDKRYYNVSMEAINCTPVSLDTIKQFVESRGF